MVRRALVVELAYAGDTVLTTPFLHNLAEFGDWEVHLVVSSPYAELMRRAPGVAEVWGFEKRKDSPVRFGRSLRRVGYEVAFVLHRSFMSALIPLFAGVHTRVGYATEFRGLLLTHRLRYEKNVHRAENHLRLLERFLSVRAERVPPRLAVSPLSEFGSRVLLNPNASWESKTLPLSYFAEVGKKLVDAGETVSVIGGPGEDDLRRAERLAEELGCDNLAGAFQLHELPDLLASASLVVSCDSGPAHISIAAGTKTAVLFSSTDPRLCGPFPDFSETSFEEFLRDVRNVSLLPQRLVVRKDVDCGPCYHKVCPFEGEKRYRCFPDGFRQ